jgi:hypothetical protein
MKKRLIITTIVAATTIYTQAATITNVLGENVATAAGWSGGNLPTSSDTVTFERNGTWSSGWGDDGSSWDGVVVTQTSGTLSGQNIFYNYLHEATWNLSGTGVISASDDMYNRGLDMTVSAGGTINSKALQLVTNASTVNILDGATLNLGARNYATRMTVASTLNLHGGVMNYTTSGNGVFRITDAGGMVDIDGGFNLVADSNSNMFYDTNSGTVNFNPTWTGSFDLADTYLAADIATELKDSGATFNGVDIDDTNISNFNIQDGSLSVVPEPSTGILLGLAGLTLIFQRRK